jgi:hypothetical protein
LSFGKSYRICGCSNMLPVSGVKTAVSLISKAEELGRSRHPYGRVPVQRPGNRGFAKKQWGIASFPGIFPTKKGY